MASHKALASAALLLALSLLSLEVSSTYLHCPPTPSPKPKPTPSPKPKPTPSPKPHKASCPKDTLKLGVCADLLGGLLGLTIGNSPKQPCCALLEGLADVKAAACLCTAVKANVLGINLNVPVDLSLLLNYCGKKLPAGFKCA